MWLFRNAFIVLIVSALFAACKGKGEINHPVSPTTKKIPVPEFRCTDTLLFRKSYALSDQKELERQEHFGPSFIDNDTTALYLKLVQKGIVRNGYLNLSVFKPVPTPLYKAGSKDSITVLLPAPKTVKNNFDHFPILFKNGEFVDTFDLSGANYALLFLSIDLLPGGYEEFLICRNYYVSNGDNYELFVFRDIQTHNIKQE